MKFDVFVKFIQLLMMCKDFCVSNKYKALQSLFWNIYLHSSYYDIMRSKAKGESWYRFLYQERMMLYLLYLLNLVAQQHAKVAPKKVYALFCISGIGEIGKNKYKNVNHNT